MRVFVCTPPSNEPQHTYGWTSARLDAQKAFVKQEKNEQKAVEASFLAL